MPTVAPVKFELFSLPGCDGTEIKRRAEGHSETRDRRLHNSSGFIREALKWNRHPLTT